jgi:aspartate carbamoyltransferase catalytic subunit
VGARRPGRDLCEVGDLDVAAACALLRTARALIPAASGEQAQGRRLAEVLRGVQILSLFAEPSTRTRISFAVAAQRLGAGIIDFHHDASSSASKGETEFDALRNLDAMGFAAVVTRDRRDGHPRRMTEFLRARVVNAGDGVREHPTQALLDTLTLLEAFALEPVPGAMRGLRVAICGDVRHGRVAHSDMRLMTLLGAEVAVAGPDALMPDDLGAYARSGLTRAPGLDAALDGAHAAIMLRVQRERLAGVAVADEAEYHAQWGLDARRLARLDARGVVLHPGPMNRGVEISDEVADGPRSRVLRQVTLGVAVRMAVLARACGVELPECLEEGAR